MRPRWWVVLVAVLLVAGLVSGAVALSGSAKPRSNGPVPATVNSAGARVVTPRITSAPSIVFTSDQSVILSGSGQQYQFTARVESNGGAKIGEPLTWQSSNPSIVQVASDGTVTAQADLGSATILVSAPGVQAQAAQVTVAKPGPDTVLVPDKAVVAVGPNSATLNPLDLTGPIRPGDILVSGSRAGLLVKVLTATTKPDGYLALTTTRASLLAAFPTLSIQAESAPTPIVVTYDQFGNATVSLPGTPRTAADSSAGVIRLDSATVPRQGAPTAAPSTTTTTEPTSSTTKETEKEPEQHCSTDVTHSVSVQLIGPSFTVNASAHLIAVLDSNSQGTHFALGVQARIPVEIKSGSVQLSASGKVSVTCDWDIKTFRLPTPVYVGPIAVSAEIGFSAGLDLSGEVDAAMTLAGPTASDTAVLYDGIEYNTSTGWTALHNNGQTGVQVAPGASNFGGSLSVDFSPYIRADFGVATALGNCTLDNLCVPLVNAEFVFLQLAGHLQFDLATPLDDLQLGYTGPSWSAGLELTAGPEIKNLQGGVIDVLQQLGLPLPGDKQWSLVDLKIPVLSSPDPHVDLTGSTAPGSKVQLQAHLQTKLFGLSDVSGLYNGDKISFVLYPKAGGTGKVVATAIMTNGTAATPWVIPANGLGSYELAALLDAPPFGALLPYESDTNPPASPVGTSTPGAPGSDVAADWSAPLSIDPAGNGVSAVSCSSPTFCTAVDASGQALTYDGNVWSKPEAVTNGGGLYSVACPAADFCVAGDQSGDVYTYNGTQWSGPDGLAGPADVMGVACGSARSCLAWVIGDNGTIYKFDGTNWTQFPGFDDTMEKLDLGSYYSADVSCPTETSCMLVDGGGNVAPYSAGSWSTPAIADPVGDGLEAVSCPTQLFCLATDFAGNAVTYRNGSWGAPQTIDPFGSGLGNQYQQSSNRPSAPYAGGFSVVCLSASTCFGYDTGGDILTYQGGSWSAPDPVDPDGGGLTDMSCPTANFCMAVDYNGSALSYSSGPPGS